MISQVEFIAGLLEDRKILAKQLRDERVVSDALLQALLRATQHICVLVDEVDTANGEVETLMDSVLKANLKIGELQSELVLKRQHIDYLSNR